MAFKYSRRKTSIVLARLIEMQIARFREYRKLVDGGFRDELRRMKKVAKGLPADDQHEYFDWHYDQLSLARDEGPQIHRAALVIAMYSVFERGLIQLCRVATNQSITARAFEKQANESYISAARRYLKKDLRLRVLDGEEWRRLDRLRLIRNCLVHDMGNVAKSSKATQRAVGNTAGVSSGNQGYLQFDVSALENFGKDIATYCKRVADAIP
ncbi:MAG: hypothetical protein KC587_16885 [Nitrospira sp.]|nr:hypothetical protein [Nitrospira sp.]